MNTARDYILIVEDDTNIREGLEHVLEFEGYPVAAVSNGREALEFLGKNPRPKLILLDWMMPQMSGGEFRVEQLKNPELAKIPVMLLSASDERIGSQLDGLVGFVRKPFDVDHLIAKLSDFARPDVPSEAEGYRAQPYVVDVARAAFA